MEKVDLAAKIRESKGKGAAHKSRAEAFVPAVLYGKKREPEMLTLVAKDIQKIMHSKAGMNMLLNVKLEGKNEEMAMLKEVQVHPVSGNLIHVDLYSVNMNEPIDVKVPVIIKGEAPGVKLGGILEFHLREIDIKCLPAKLPDSIEVDISALNLGDTVHVKDLKVAEGITIKDDLNETVLLVSIPQVEEEVAAPAEGAPTGPEVIGEKEREEKKAAAEAEKGGAAKPDAKAEGKGEGKKEDSKK